jgi:hypothetical protein
MNAIVLTKDYLSLRQNCKFEIWLLCHASTNSQFIKITYLAAGDSYL